ncbi:hypothetical protein Bbelb_305150 [Branchiostoma belcheri]|nr:hypothetical protein Bbelb_305150 [Branchiostoma belcheri]
MSGSRRTYRTLPLDVPHSPAERIALSRRTSRTLPREVPHSVRHSPAERPSKIDAYFVACAYQSIMAHGRDRVDQLRWNGMSTGMSLTHIYAHIPGTLKTCLPQLSVPRGSFTIHSGEECTVSVYT